MLQNYTLFWQSVFSLTDCTWHDVTLNITFTRAFASCKSDFLATFCSDPSLFWLAINSLYCSLTWKHGPCSFAHQSLLAGHLVSRPWFARVNPTSGSELRLQLPASLILVGATCNVSFNIRCVHLDELVACMFYWVCRRTALVPMSLCMGISDKRG